MFSTAKKKIALALILIPVLLVAILSLLLQLKLNGFERDMRIYLTDRGVAESEIVEIEAKRSMLPTYPVYVRFAHDPDRAYMFKPDEEAPRNFVLLESRIPPQLVDREAQNAEYSAFLEAYGFTYVKRLGMTDSSVLAENAAASKLLQAYRSVSENDSASLYGQRVHTYKFSVDHPQLRKQWGLQDQDQMEAYLMKVGDLVRGGYVEVREAQATGQKKPKYQRYTLRGDAVES
ncbi:hypothetical protein [Saccharibacillus sacchari]|uniref:Uncharacterized protein n=1 Tax=Saccharibacillus sacchari TaxID=456493 RepID=A0ACC6PI17_9BACL